MKTRLLIALALGLLTGCSEPAATNKPVIGFVDAFEDATLAQAKNGFVKALADSGYSEEKKTLTFLYRNAQGNLPALSQIVQYYLGQKVTALATCPSLSTITALQATKTTPVFMMVAPEPALMKLKGSNGQAPANLFGVGENLDYIDTSFGLIAALVKPRQGQLAVGMIYNQSEPQSVEALNRINALAARQNVRLEALPVSSSNEVQLVAQSLAGKGIDAFFANPDNTVFASFETIVRTCNQAKVPVFTSEAGLVARGAVAAYGADLFQWGYQAGAQCARYLRQGNGQGLRWEMVKERKRLYNPKAAQLFQLQLPADFQAL